jgi:hypothetical protein
MSKILNMIMLRSERADIMLLNNLAMALSLSYAFYVLPQPPTKLALLVLLHWSDELEEIRS